MRLAVGLRVACRNGEQPAAQRAQHQPIALVVEQFRALHPLGAADHVAVGALGAALPAAGRGPVQRNLERVGEERSAFFFQAAALVPGPEFEQVVAFRRPRHDPHYGLRGGCLASAGRKDQDGVVEDDGALVLGHGEFRRAHQEPLALRLGVRGDQLLRAAAGELRQPGLHQLTVLVGAENRLVALQHAVGGLLDLPLLAVLRFARYRGVRQHRRDPDQQVRRGIHHLHAAGARGIEAGEAAVHDLFVLGQPQRPARVLRHRRRRLRLRGKRKRAERGRDDERRAALHWLNGFLNWSLPVSTAWK